MCYVNVVSATCVFCCAKTKTTGVAAMYLHVADYEHYYSLLSTLRREANLDLIWPLQLLVSDEFYYDYCTSTYHCLRRMAAAVSSVPVVIQNARNVFIFISHSSYESLHKTFEIPPSRICLRARASCKNIGAGCWSIVRGSPIGPPGDFGEKNSDKRSGAAWLPPPTSSPPKGVRVRVRVTFGDQVAGWSGPTWKVEIDHTPLAQRFF